MTRERSVAPRRRVRPPDPMQPVVEKAHDDERVEFEAESLRLFAYFARMIRDVRRERAKHPPLAASFGHASRRTGIYLSLVMLLALIAWRADVGELLTALLKIILPRLI